MGDVVIEMNFSNCDFLTFQNQDPFIMEPSIPVHIGSVRVWLIGLAHYVSRFPCFQLLLQNWSSLEKHFSLSSLRYKWKFSIVVFFTFQDGGEDLKLWFKMFSVVKFWDDAPNLLILKPRSCSIFSFEGTLSSSCGGVSALWFNDKKALSSYLLFCEQIRVTPVCELFVLL